MTCTHPVAIEFSVAHACVEKEALLVSAPSDAGHRLDQQRLHEILTSVI